MIPRRAVAALLERERPWAWWRGAPWALDPVRRLPLPSGAAVVGVGGATLGGSGKTPLAIALAGALVSRGHRVALVGHGYRSDVRGRAREVGPTSSVAEVGDEALIAAWALAGRAAVVVGRSRAEALTFAAGLASVVIVDGLLQAHPASLAYSVLALDASGPWGSGRVFPFGDLLVRRERLEDLADGRVLVGGAECPAAGRLAAPLPHGTRVALVSTMARPERFARSAAGLGVEALFHVKRPDHEPIAPFELRRLRRLALAHRLDAWCIDAKTEAHLSPWGGRPLGAPAVPLLHWVAPSASILDRIEAALTTRARRAAAGAPAAAAVALSGSIRAR